MNIFAFNINNRLSKNIITKFMNLISKDKYVKIKKLKCKEDVQRSLIAEILIRYIIFKRYKISNNEISFVFNEYGKPFLNNINNFYFNISHSGEWIVCAIDSNYIGIDIEFIKPIDFEIAQRYFSEKEYSYFLAKKDSDKLNYFYDLWTLKESFIKAVGKGLSIPLNSFSIIKENNSIFLISDNSNAVNFKFKQYNIDSRYKLSVCYMNKHHADCIKIISLDRLLKVFK